MYNSSYTSSDVYTSRLGRNSLPNGNFKASRKSDRSFSMGSPLKRNPVKWSTDKMFKVREFFRDRKYPYRYLDFSPTYEEFGREIQLFALALDANHETGGIIPCEELIFYSSTGPQYTKVLKEFRKQCFFRSIDAMTFKEAPIEDFKTYNLDVRPLDYIDQVFPYRFLIFWEEDCDDTENYRIPVKFCDKTLNRFRSTLSNLLESIPKSSYDPRLEILFEVSSSKSLIDGKSKFLVDRKFRGRKIEKYFSRVFEPCKRAVVPVYPGGYRDTVITTPETSSSIKLIDRVVSELLRSLPYHLYDKDANQIFRILTKSVNKSGFRTFICRDIQKEGITKPRQLLTIMLEEVSKIYPVLGDYINFYESFLIEGIDTKRGHGLGMANSLTTLMQVVISSMIIQDMSDCGFDVSSVEMYSFNDDYVCLIPDEQVEDYWVIEGEIMKGLSILRKDEKSFKSAKGLVFCENYVLRERESFTKKDISYRRNLLLPFAFDFIWEAKDFTSSMGPEYVQDLEKMMEEYISFWGYEFFPEEVQYPSSCGGWYSTKILGYSDDIFRLQDLPYDTRVRAAFKAVHTPLYCKMKRHRNKFTSFAEQLVVSDDVLKRVMPLGDKEEVYNHYKVYFKLSSLLPVIRENYNNRRREVFLEYLRKDISYEEFLSEVRECGKHIPLPSEIEWIECDRIVPAFDDPYVQSTPLANYLLSKGEEIAIGISFTPEEYSLRSYNPKVSKYWIPMTEGQFWNSIFLEGIVGIPINKDQFEIDDQELEDLPNLLTAITKYYHQEDKYPKVLTGRKPELRDIKLKVYGDFLSLDEQLMVSFGDLRKENIRFIFCKAQSYAGLTAEQVSSLISEIPLCGYVSSGSEEESVQESENEEIEESKELAILSLDEFLSRNLKSDLPSEDIYTIMRDSSQHSLYIPAIREGLSLFKELHDLYYFMSKNINRDDFIRQRIERFKTPMVLNIAELMRDQGYCLELVQLLGLEVQEEELILETESLFGPGS